MQNSPSLRKTGMAGLLGLVAMAGSGLAHLNPSLKDNYPVPYRPSRRRAASASRRLLGWPRSQYNFASPIHAKHGMRGIPGTKLARKAAKGRLGVRSTPVRAH